MSNYSKPKGAQSPRWKGGRRINEAGYVRVRMGNKEVREHRMVAEKMIGRPLLPGEQVHHKNGIRSDNRPENLEVMPSQHHHYAKHRRPGCVRRLPGEPNPPVRCACGCGKRLTQFDAKGRPRFYATGHGGRRGLPTPPALLVKLQRHVS